MAYTALTVQDVSLAGVTPSYVAATLTDGNSFANDGKVLLHVKNTGSQITLTVAAVAKLAGVSLTNPAIVIPATTGDKMIGPFDPTVFNQAAGVVYVTYTAVTGVTIAAIRLPNP